MVFVEHHYMARALQLAARGLYSAHPNPRVGCVLVRDDEIVGEGWHRQAGEAHAEVNALTQAGARARGATAYVTLEPCCHCGRTPPCSEALIKAGVGRVVVAMTDPNPQVAGKGMEQLKKAGVTVDSGLLREQALALNAGFVMRMREQRPWVRCKLAMSLDGGTALANGRSRWITGAEARVDVQRLRSQSGAIMTGIGTVLVDDPALTVRLPETGPKDAEHYPCARQPLRVVVDSRLRMPTRSRMLNLSGRTLVMTTSHEQALQENLMRAGAAVIPLPEQDSRVDLLALLHYLAAEHEINEVLLEAGATLSGAMLKAGLIDELVIYMAPVLLGDGARGLLHWWPALEDMKQRINLKIVDVRAIGDDWRITAKPAETRRE